jgi:hypothetical protein
MATAAMFFKNTMAAAATDKIKVLVFSASPAKLSPASAHHKPMRKTSKNGCLLSCEKLLLSFVPVGVVVLRMVVVLLRMVLFLLRPVLFTLCMVLCLLRGTGGLGFNPGRGH